MLEPKSRLNVLYIVKLQSNQCDTLVYITIKSVCVTLASILVLCLHIGLFGYQISSFTFDRVISLLKELLIITNMHKVNLYTELVCTARSICVIVYSLVTH